MGFLLILCFRPAAWIVITEKYKIKKKMVGKGSKRIAIKESKRILTSQSKFAEFENIIVTYQLILYLHLKYKAFVSMAALIFSSSFFDLEWCFYSPLLCCCLPKVSELVCRCHRYFLTFEPLVFIPVFVLHRV